MTLPTRDDSDAAILEAYFADLLDEDAAGAEEPVAEAAPARPQTPPAAGERCVAFDLAGLELLIPEEAIAGVDTGQPELTGRLPGNWLAGYCLSAGKRVAVVDTPLLLGLPGSAVTAGRAGTLVKLVDQDYALAVPAEGISVDINAAEVTWRSEGGRRPWLAGTLASRRGMMLDIRGLAALVPAADDGIEADDNRVANHAAN